MDKAPLDLASARILITNDDGIHAPGLEALERIAKSLSNDVWVVAPEVEQSATSHSLTLRRPLRIREFGPRRYAVDGTPTDCVLVARHHLLADHPPDIVFSGINHGANLGEDMTYSGTVAGAMEAALLGLRAIAFSQMRDADRVISWSTAEGLLPDVAHRLAGLSWKPGLLFNVNFPPLPPEKVAGIRLCRQGKRVAGIELVEGEDPAGRHYLWVGNFRSDEALEPDTDLAATDSGSVSVTPLHLDLTDKAVLEDLSGIFA